MFVYVKGWSMNHKTVILLRQYADAFVKNYREVKREYGLLPWNERFEYKKRLRKELKQH